MHIFCDFEMKKHLFLLLFVCFSSYVSAIDFTSTKHMADQGDAIAQFNLGRMYFIGDGVSQNYQEAATWFSKAAEQGVVEAQFNLGSMYNNGVGVVENDQEAVKWYRKAAEQGNAKAQFKLGSMYDKNADSQGVLDDDQEAVKWYRKAAEQGHEKAQFFLALRYAIGSGVAENKSIAYMWANIARFNGNESSNEFLEKISALMSKDEIINAQKMAYKCLESKYNYCY